MPHHGTGREKLLLVVELSVVPGGNGTDGENSTPVGGFFFGVPADRTISLRITSSAVEEAPEGDVSGEGRI